jgi:hypothetical protein
MEGVDYAKNHQNELNALILSIQKEDKKEKIFDRVDM